jgi:serine/threonine protein kinase
MKPLTKHDPREIGGYTLVSRLGSGGMGDVYVAVKDGENVAVKIIRDAFTDDSAYVARFQREIDTLKAVSHPNVIRFIDSGVDDERLWYASEFAGGLDLNKTLQGNGPLQGSAWRMLADGLIRGLTAIHQQNTVHRDIKPANIIMSAVGPKIIDLGIAKGDDETSLTQTGMAPGTPAWFSPEHVDGREITAASDFYSAGVVLAFAATGTTPWGPPTSVTYQNIVRKMSQTPDLSGLSSEQREFVSGLLNPNPTTRLAHAKKLATSGPSDVAKPVIEADKEFSVEVIDLRKAVPKKEPGSNPLVAFGILFALFLGAIGVGYSLLGNPFSSGTTIAQAQEMARDLDNQERRALRTANTLISHLRTHNYPQFFRYGSDSWRNAETFVRANWDVHGLGDRFRNNWDVNSIERVDAFTISATACSAGKTFTKEDDVELFRIYSRDNPQNFSHMAVKEGVPYFFFPLCEFAPESEYAQALRLIGQWEEDLRIAIDAGSEAYLEFIKDTNYPGLYDFESERWVAGEDIVRETWSEFRDLAFFEFNYKSAGILDLELNQDDRGCSPTVTYFPRTLWILEIVPEADPYPNYFIIENGILYNTYAFCRVLEEEGFPA